MASIAKKALQEARLRLSGKNKLSKATTQVAAGPVANQKPKNMEVVITGPINHFMLLEGRSWALEIVTSLQAAPLTVIIEHLSGAATGRPSSYAAGIKSVIKELQGTDVTGQRDGDYLTHQVE